eukprot:m.203147 g.203147  ORF g.203147 m.203147 type:complete len:125 (+) comp17070_c0_seq5:1278-1652(+)
MGVPPITGGTKVLEPTSAIDQENQPQPQSHVPPAPKMEALQASAPLQATSLKAALSQVKLKRAEQPSQSQPAISGSTIAMALHRVLAQRRVALVRETPMVKRSHSLRANCFREEMFRFNIVWDI